MAEQVCEQALLYPQFIEKLLWGEKVAGLRVTLAKAKPQIVNALIRQAWENKAPKSLQLHALPANFLHTKEHNP